MSKSNFFTGQPIFSQVLSFLPKSSIDRLADECQADRYCRYFTTYNHLISVLYAVFNKCNSIREVTSGLMAWEQRINHLGLDRFPKRSTISDANTRRSETVFEKIYHFLYTRHKHLLPDSRRGKSSNLYIADSTTISLFQEVLRNAGRSPASPKQYTFSSSKKRKPTLYFTIPIQTRTTFG